MRYKALPLLPAETRLLLRVGAQVAVTVIVANTSFLENMLVID